MSIICFASLKGGVGKTSLSINVAHAFAERGCRTLLIDFDPAGHATRFFGGKKSQLSLKAAAEQTAEQATAATGKTPSQRAPFLSNAVELVRIFLDGDSSDPRENGSREEGFLDLDKNGESLLVQSARKRLDFIAGGNELRHLLLGRGAKTFARKFPALIEELSFQYDTIIIDTSPDFNLLTRNSLAVADLVVCPVDPSEMSIYSLEELLHSARHIRRPTWVVVRTMVNKKAQRTSALSTDRLRERLAPMSTDDRVASPEETDYDIEDPHQFMQMLQDWERSQCDRTAKGENSSAVAQSPIYLLRSLVYRTEQQNQLSFVGRTAFDTKSNSALAEQYLAVARELEMLSDSEVVGSGDGGDDDSSEDVTDSELDGEDAFSLQSGQQQSTARRGEGVEQQGASALPHPAA